MMGDITIHRIDMMGGSFVQRRMEFYLFYDTKELEIPSVDLQ